MNKAEVVMDEKIIQVIVAGACRSAAWSSFWSTSDAKELMRSALASLEKGGYVVRKVKYIEHENVDFGSPSP